MVLSNPSPTPGNSAQLIADGSLCLAPATPGHLVCSLHSFPSWFGISGLETVWACKGPLSCGGQLGMTIVSVCGMWVCGMRHAYAGILQHSHRIFWLCGHLAMGRIRAA
jgi:hypothetical protein